MRSKLLSLVALFMLTYSPQSSVCGACRAKINNVDELKIIVPLAVPVGVPVAPFAPYFYSYQQFQAPTAPAAASVPRAAAASPAESLMPREQISSLVAARCATCHGGPSPKAGLSLEHPDGLSISDRLRAIRAVAAGRMPKGKTLTADELRAVTEELAKEPETAKQPETKREASSDSPSQVP